MSYLLASENMIGAIIAFLVCAILGLTALYVLILLYRWILGTDKIIAHLDDIKQASTIIPPQLTMTDQKLETLQQTQNDIKTLLNAIEKNTSKVARATAKLAEPEPNQSDPPDPSN